MTKKFAFMKWEGMNEVGQGEEKPMSKKLKPDQFIVLQAIAMYQKAGGFCDTTQQQFSEVIPYSRESIGKTLKSLVEFTYEGKPVLERFEEVGATGKKQWVHRLLPNPLFGVYGEKPTTEEEPLCEESSHHNSSLCEETSHTKEINTKEIILNNTELKEEPVMKNERMTNKQIVSYFTGLLKDKGIETKFSYPAVMKKMKTVEPLFADLINNEIKKVCEVIVAEYGAGEIKSNLNEYPLNIHVLTRKWVVEKAINLVKKEKENSSQMKERSVEDNKVTISSVSRILGRKKKGGAI